MYIFHMFLLCHHSNDNHQNTGTVCRGTRVVRKRTSRMCLMISLPRVSILLRTSTQQRSSLQSWVVATVRQCSSFRVTIECVAVSRLRHRPTLSTRKSLEHQHSNTTLEHRWSSCLRVHVTKTGSFSMCNLSSSRDGYASISQVHDRICLV